MNDITTGKMNIISKPRKYIPSNYHRIRNKCFWCKWCKQTSTCVKCKHPNKIIYKRLDEPCEICGRKDSDKINGCGNCIGRGSYCYPYMYDDCDCGGFEFNKKK